ncbi:MAG: hypothetical protein CVU77_05790 [Elusimicrobia bacterium HGW-Elusimicrobia-1]|jgi:hypothetical protein|nr:MAG: hypothetical protein CVU77_05790 [Elusimicrobia bacterium HGW-Elusimicrobia-1]
MGFKKIAYGLLFLWGMSLASRLYAPPPGWVETRPTIQEEIAEYEKKRVLSPRASALKNIFEELKINPASPALQAEYLQYFPENQRDFDAIFGYDMDAPGWLEGAKELYRSGNEYILILEKFNRRYMPYICKISLDIAKESSAFEVDRYGELRMLMTGLLFKNPEIFRKKLFSLAPPERAAAIRFAIQHIYGEQFPGFFAKLRKDGDNEFISLIGDAIKWGVGLDMGCSCRLLPPDATSYIINISSDTAEGGCEHH